MDNKRQGRQLKIGSTKSPKDKTRPNDRIKQKILNTIKEDSSLKIIGKEKTK